MTALVKTVNLSSVRIVLLLSSSARIAFHANHLYTPRPTKTADVLVMAALLLPMPNMLLLLRITASCALSCECPEMYVNAPRPRNVALPTVMSVFASLLQSKSRKRKNSRSYPLLDTAYSHRTEPCLA